MSIYQPTPDGYGLYLYLCGYCKGNGCPYCDLTGEPKPEVLDRLGLKQPTNEEILAHYLS